MPRCYMVKKYYQPLTRSPPCSPPEACVAPPWYYPPEDHSTQTDRGRKGGEHRNGENKAESGGNCFKTVHADTDDDLTDSELGGYGKKMEKIKNTDEGGKMETFQNIYDDEETNFGLILDMSLNVIDDDDTNDRLIVDESKLLYDDDETRDGLVVDESKNFNDEETRDRVIVDEAKNIDEDAQDGFAMDGIKYVGNDMKTQDCFTINESKNSGINDEIHYGLMMDEGKKFGKQGEKQVRFMINEKKNSKESYNSFAMEISKNVSDEGTYHGLIIDESNNLDDDVDLDFGMTVIEGDLSLRVKQCDKVDEGEKLDEVIQAENLNLNGGQSPAKVLKQTVQGEKVGEGGNVDKHENDGGDEGGCIKYAQLGVTPLSERSAADTEAAHELLSLAAGVPPLPPAAVVSMLEPEPQPMIPVPLYTYAIPTNIFILAEEPSEPIYHTVQAMTPIPQVNYATIDPQGNYIAYQETPVPCAAVPMDYQPLYRECISQPVVVQPVMMEPIAVPVSVIEPTPMVHPVSIVEPVSVQVPVIEMVPQVNQHLTPPIAIPDPVPQPPEQKVPEQRKRRTRVENAGKFDCSECGKRYATSSNLSRHKQTHRSLDSVAAKRCEECGKAYVSMPALAMHVLTHRMGHVCGVCGKQFSRPWLLRGHLRSHTGEKPYRCLSCSKAFADRSNLRAHLQTHAADKKFECNRCNKNFALKSYLSKHQESACVREEDQ